MTLTVHKYFLGVRDKVPDDVRLKMVTCQEAGGHKWLVATNGNTMHLERVDEQENVATGTYFIPIRSGKSPYRELVPVQPESVKPWRKLPAEVASALTSLKGCVWDLPDYPLLESDTIKVLEQGYSDIYAYIGESEGLHKVILGSRYELDMTPNLAFYNAGYVLKAIRWLQADDHINGFCIQPATKPTNGYGAIGVHSLALAAFKDGEAAPSKMAVIMGMWNVLLRDTFRANPPTRLLTIPELPKEKEESLVSTTVEPDGSLSS